MNVRRNNLETCGSTEVSGLNNLLVKTHLKREEVTA